MAFGAMWSGREVEAFENDLWEKHPPDGGAAPEGFTDDKGRIVRRWTSGGRRLEAVITVAPTVALESLHDLDA